MVQPSVQLAERDMVDLDVFGVGAAALGFAS